PHFAVEQALLKAGMAYTFVRPGFFMQNANTAYRDDIRFRNEINVPAGKGRLALIDVRDVAAVAAKSLAESGHAHKIYSITGSEALRFDEVAALISKATGRTIRYTRPSTSAFRMHQRRMGAAEDYIDVMNSIYFPVRMNLAGGISDEFARIMGRPPILFARYAADYAAQWAAPTTEERAAYDARLAAIPEPPRESWFAGLRDRLGGGGMGRIGA
ncbi:MAG: NmrA family NAD(P)-binding protein, partial [Caldilineaceae bacterium]